MAFTWLLSLPVLPFHKGTGVLPSSREGSLSGQLGSRIYAQSAVTSVGWLEKLLLAFCGWGAALRRAGGLGPGRHAEARARGGLAPEPLREVGRLVGLLHSTASPQPSPA